MYAGEPRAEPVDVRVVIYDAERVDGPRPWRAGRDDPTAGKGVTWVDVVGIHDASIVGGILGPLGIHPLWVEDVLNPETRTKLEMAPDRLLLIARMFRVADRALVSEQIALVCGPGWVVSFQEQRGDVWDPIRARIQQPGTRIRGMGSTYLFHRLLDAVVDEYFEVVETHDASVDDIEELALSGQARDLPARIRAARNEIVAFRAAVWPLREASAQLARAEVPILDEAVRPFFRDVHDHVLQVVERTEAARDRLNGALELHLAMTSHDLNVVMRWLTVVSSIFIPLTFVAGIYGMNFRYMPELEWRFGYPAVLGVMAALGLGMAWMFRRRGWL